MKDRKPKDFFSIGSLIQTQIVERMQDSENAPENEEIQAEIRKRWGRCAGRAAGASIPLLFRSGRLVIFTESAIWATELRHQQQLIRNELESFNINEIEVKARPGILPQTRGKQRQVSISDGSRQHLRSTASRLRHDGLRSALRRLADKTEKGNRGNRF